MDQVFYDENRKPYYLVNGVRYYQDDSGQYYSHDKDGKIFYLDYYNCPYYKDEKGEPYYIDNNGIIYYYDSSGQAYYYDNQGFAVYYDQNYQEYQSKLLNSISHFLKIPIKIYEKRVFPSMLDQEYSVIINQFIDLETLKNIQAGGIGHIGLIPYFYKDGNKYYIFTNIESVYKLYKHSKKEVHKLIGDIGGGFGKKKSETPYQALLREIIEETGDLATGLIDQLERSTPLIYVSENVSKQGNYNYYNITILLETQNLELKNFKETKEVKGFIVIEEKDLDNTLYEEEKDTKVSMGIRFFKEFKHLLPIIVK